MHLMVSKVAQHLNKVFKQEINKVQGMEEVVVEINVTDLLLHLILVNKLGNKGKHCIYLSINKNDGKISKEKLFSLELPFKLNNLK